MDSHRIISPDELADAHRHSSLHEAEIKQSQLCGCFHCLAEFPPSAISEWIDDRNVPEGTTGMTALCPKCGVDSVIGSSSGYSITQFFLKAMNGHWFSC